MKKDTRNAYLRAEKQVKDIKCFYKNLFVYVAFLILWILYAKRFIRFILSEAKDDDVGFINWLDINLWLTPVFWGFILLIYGLYVFTDTFNFFKKWEKKKIEEFMAGDSEGAKNNQWE